MGRLPRNVWLVGLISLVNDSASELIYPLLPLVLTTVLAAGPRALGLIEGLAEASASLLKLFSGVILDRTGRAKPWILGGYGLAALARPLLALVTSWPGLLLLRLLDRAGKGLRTSPRDALLAASVAPTQRGLAFGLHRAMDNAGAVIGPLAAAGLLAAHLPLQRILLWSALPGGLCLALALALREPVPPSGPQLTAAAIAPARPEAWPGPLPPQLRRYLVVVALFSAGNASNLFLLLRARELGVPEAGIPLLWAAVSAVAMVASTPLSAWSDRVGRRRVLGCGYLAYGLFYLLMAGLGSGGPWLFALFGFYGLFMAATEGVEKALVADLAPAALRGTAFGWFNMTTALMLLPASLLFGWLYQGAGPATAFALAGGCSLGAAALLALWMGPAGAGPANRA
nr:MFS transporter [Synechococcus sp. CCY 9618]